jgi:hypothetical protein
VHLNCVSAVRVACWCQRPLSAHPFSQSEHIVTDIEKARQLTDITANISRWSAMPRTEYRTRALKNLNLSAKYLRGEKVPAWVAASFE